MEQPETFETKISPESRERGANVRITLKFMRHGERSKEGQLIDLGRDITKEQAKKSGIDSNDYDLIKAIGSDVGPKSHVEGDAHAPKEMGRALETAHIYAENVEGVQGVTRARNALGYHTLITPPPYDHVAVYDGNLPENFEELENEERIAAAKHAQDAVMDHLSHLDNEEAQTFKKEVAGAFATTIEHYMSVAKRLKSNSNVLIPAGTHGGMVEFLLQQALVQKNDGGEQQLGFENINSIGGGIMPSEAFNVEIATDEQGDLKELSVTFDSPERPNTAMTLDATQIKELAAFYESMHTQSTTEQGIA